jgi:hypothetical protein
VFYNNLYEDTDKRLQEVHKKIKIPEGFEYTSVEQ